MLRQIFGRRDTSGEESWGEVGSKLTRAVLALAQAEASGLKQDLRGSYAILRRLLLGLAVGLGLAMFSVALLLAAALLGLSQVMHPALAALSLGGVLAIVSLFWLLQARRAAARLETPAHTVGRRVSDHLDWWREEVKTVARPDAPRKPMPSSGSSEGEDRPGQERSTETATESNVGLREDPDASSRPGGE